MAITELNQWDLAEVYHYEGKVWIAVETNHGREQIGMTVEQARSFANDIVREAADAGFAETDKS